jgi:hypothetical protein
VLTPNLKYGTYQTVARRNVTRWNLEHRLLGSSLCLKSAIIKVTTDPALKLRAYALSDLEWQLASDLFDMLSVIPINIIKFCVLITIC